MQAWMFIRFAEGHHADTGQSLCSPLFYKGRSSSCFRKQHVAHRMSGSACTAVRRRRRLLPQGYLARMPPRLSETSGDFLQPAPGCYLYILPRLIP